MKFAFLCHSTRKTHWHSSEGSEQRSGEKLCRSGVLSSRHDVPGDRDFCALGRKEIGDVPNVLGDVTPTPIAGEVRFRLNGQDFTLAALGGDPAKGLSFVISDLTAKTETYPGGRFLDTDPVVDGKVVLDFNRAYNPPCAVTPYATCPLAPKENRLVVAIAAGEKYDRKRGHQ